MLEVAEQLKHMNPNDNPKEITFLYPKLLLYRPSTKVQASAERLESTMNEVISERDGAEQRIQNIAGQVATEESKLAVLLAEAAEKNKRGHGDSVRKGGEITALKEKLVGERLELERQQARFAALDSQWKALQASLSRSDATSGIVPLQLIQQAEELLARFSDQEMDTYLFWAEVTTAGGSYQVRRNLWRSLFWSDGLRYSGGAIASFAFFDADANILLSGIHRYHEPFTRFGAIWWPPRTTGNSF